MRDLNSELKNAAVTYRNKAANLEQEARELDQELDSPYGRLPGGRRILEAKIERARAEAAWWLRCADDADAGLYRMEAPPGGVGPAVPMFPELRAEAIRQDRVKNVAPVRAYSPQPPVSTDLDS